MNIENLLQLGFAGGIAVYLVVWMTKRLDERLNKILDVLACIVEALGIKGGK
jgi:hypothetical protein